MEENTNDFATDLLVSTFTGLILGFIAFLITGKLQSGIEVAIVVALGFGIFLYLISRIPFKYAVIWYIYTILCYLVVSFEYLFIDIITGLGITGWFFVYFFALYVINLFFWPIFLFYPSLLNILEIQYYLPMPIFLYIPLFTSSTFLVVLYIKKRRNKEQFDI